jgi:tRNA(fMet)-specific endonuclease VapC
VSRQFLLDTNIVSAYLKREKSITLRISEIDYFLSPIVVGELYKWAFGSPRKADLLATVRHFISLSEIRRIDEATTERYGIIAADLEARGQPIPDNDLWIAAQAMRYNLILATRDDHFTHVEGLDYEMW